MKYSQLFIFMIFLNIVLSTDKEKKTEEKKTEEPKKEGENKEGEKKGTET